MRYETRSLHDCDRGSIGSLAECVRRLPNYPPPIRMLRIFRIRRRSMRTRSLSRSSITRRRSFMYRRTRIRTSREIRSGCALTARTPRRTVPWPRAATSTRSFATTAGRWCGASSSCRATACTAATFPRSHWNASGTTRLRPIRSTCAIRGRSTSSRSRSRSGPIRRAAGRSATPRCAKSRTSTSRSSPKGAT